MEKIDFSKPDFTDVELEYAELKIADVKLDQREWEAKFGSDYPYVSNSLPLRKYIADEKAKNQKQKRLSRNLKQEEFVKLVPPALKVIYETIIGVNTDKLKFEAAKLVARPSLASIERSATTLADIDLATNEATSEGFQLIVNKLNAKSS